MCSDFFRSLFGYDVAAFTCGNNHAGIVRTIFYYGDDCPAEKSHFDGFPVSVGENFYLRIFREVAEEEAIRKFSSFRLSTLAFPIIVFSTPTPK